jgi:hypothetical protein
LLSYYGTDGVTYIKSRETYVSNLDKYDPYQFNTNEATVTKQYTDVVGGHVSQVYLPEGISGERYDETINVFKTGINYSGIDFNTSDYGVSAGFQIDFWEFSSYGTTYYSGILRKYDNIIFFNSGGKVAFHVEKVKLFDPDLEPQLSIVYRSGPTNPKGELSPPSGSLFVIEDFNGRGITGFSGATWTNLRYKNGEIEIYTDLNDIIYPGKYTLNLQADSRSIYDVFFACWGTDPDCIRLFDYNNDGLVNGDDLGIFLGQWSNAETRSTAYLNWPGSTLAAEGERSSVSNPVLTVSDPNAKTIFLENIWYNNFFPGIENSKPYKTIVQKAEILNDFDFTKPFNTNEQLERWYRYGISRINTNAPVQTPDKLLGLSDFKEIVWSKWFKDVAGETGAQGLQGLQGTQGITGSQGLQGLQGLQGTIGSQGLQGLQGLQGTIGSQGLQGLQGLQGTTGSQGLQGLQGTTGSQGLQGLQGLQGRQGTTGSQGLQGLQGTQGSTGSQGLQGLQGTQGSLGAQGLQGIGGGPVFNTPVFANAGLQVLSGITVDDVRIDTTGIIFEGNTPRNLRATGLRPSFIIGAKVSEGVTFGDLDDSDILRARLSAGNGYIELLDSVDNPNPTIEIVGPVTIKDSIVAPNIVNSVQGITGDVKLFGDGITIQTVSGSKGITLSVVGGPGGQGVQGIQGTQGLQGLQGLQGIQGRQGLQGLQGLQGTQGSLGAQGLQGLQGTQGTLGAQGIQGLQGRQGTTGTGIQGLQGLQGPAGSGGGGSNAIADLTPDGGATADIIAWKNNDWNVVKPNTISFPLPNLGNILTTIGGITYWSKNAFNIITGITLGAGTFLVSNTASSDTGSSIGRNVSETTIKQGTAVNFPNIVGGGTFMKDGSEDSWGNYSGGDWYHNGWAIKLSGATSGGAGPGGGFGGGIQPI